MEKCFEFQNNQNYVLFKKLKFFSFIRNIFFAKGNFKIIIYLGENTFYIHFSHCFITEKEKKE